MFKGAIKDKIIPVILFLLSLLIVFLIMRQATATKEVIEVPVLNKDYAMGMQIQESDILMKEMGKHNLDGNVIKSKEEIKGMFTNRELKKGRLVYQEDVSKEKLKSSMLYDIKSGAVSVTTNLVKSVGGLPKAGDWVQVKIIKQDTQTRQIEVLSYAELEAVKLISIQAQTGDQVKHDNSKESGGILASNTELKPALATFDAKAEQVEALLEGEYAGELHMVMLPAEQQDDSLQESFYEDRLKRALERKKQELEEQEGQNPQTADEQAGGAPNEIRR